jgi:hypothetical protein
VLTKRNHSRFYLRNGTKSRIVTDRQDRERNGLDLTSDAFNPEGFYVGSSPGAIHWTVTYRGPEQGAAIEDCGFAKTAEAAQAIANCHWRGLLYAR